MLAPASCLASSTWGFYRESTPIPASYQPGRMLPQQASSRASSGHAAPSRSERRRARSSWAASSPMMRVVGKVAALKRRVVVRMQATICAYSPLISHYEPRCEPRVFQEAANGLGGKRCSPAWGRPLRKSPIQTNHVDKYLNNCVVGFAGGASGASVGLVRRSPFGHVEAKAEGVEPAGLAAECMSDASRCVFSSNLSMQSGY
jgi:hypothetical protein